MQDVSSNSFSRTSSMTSIGSTDSTESITSSRRTRKRFNNVQLMMLENLFHHSPHPSRQERETLAKAGNMETKSVTIWFQNKRQLERKGSSATLDTQSRRSSPSSAPYTFAPASSQPLVARPSLDRVASRSELPQSSPRTPSRHRDPARPIWEAMPSSPSFPVMSPSAKDYVEFGKLTRTRTLEWACARRRLAAKSGDNLEEDDEMEEDDMIAHRKSVYSRTDSSTRSVSTVSEKEGRMLDVSADVEPAGKVYPGVEEDMLKAALALCGLQGKS
ncbi:homeodomain transcription factor [Lentinula raphanica]|uniref:Homeodomain transcription factor n=1 Tax=Lentinula raphanica TaxID=153919 RepID=A0AA38UF55_9AGAR|nr:homeodomain transcription factor [Lentinula raphanica]KAJ3970614.1 homeodomain transcription factor [Lentinula raphanica]